MCSLYTVYKWYLNISTNLFPLSALRGSCFLIHQYGLFKPLIPYSVLKITIAGEKWERNAIGRNAITIPSLTPCPYPQKTYSLKVLYYSSKFYWIHGQKGTSYPTRVFLLPEQSHSPVSLLLQEKKGICRLPEMSRHKLCWAKAKR